MTPDSVSQLVRQLLMATFWLSAPLLAIGFVAGLIVSLLQIVTSIQDSAVSTVPRLAAFMLAIVIFMPWMLMKLMAYTTSILGDLSRFAH
jgi:flagellar biosynthetic protein FliQ